VVQLSPTPAWKRHFISPSRCSVTWGLCGCDLTQDPKLSQAATSTSPMRRQGATLRKHGERDTSRLAGNAERFLPSRRHDSNFECFRQCFHRTDDTRTSLVNAQVNSPPL
jgi:hypothetical protein